MAITSKDSFGTRDTLKVGSKSYEVFRLDTLAKKFPAVAALPVSMKGLLEALLRNEGGVSGRGEDIGALATWKGGGGARRGGQVLGRRPRPLGSSGVAAGA